MKKSVFVFLGLLLLLTAPAGAAREESRPAGVPGLDPPESIPGISAAPAESIPAPRPVTPIVPIDDIPAVSAQNGGGTGPAGGDEGGASPKVIEREPGRGNVRDICRYWEENGYPEGVSYACETGDERLGDMTYALWEIGLAEDSAERRQEILDLISPFCLVEFRKARFSHEEKAAAYSRLTELARTDENILEIGFTRNADTVWVTVPEERVEEYAAYLSRECGLGEVVSVTDEHWPEGPEENGTVAGTESGTEQDGGPAPETPAAAEVPAAVWLGLAAAVGTAAVCLGLTLRSFLAPTAAAAREEKRPRGDAPLSRRQEEAVGESAEVPRRSALRKTEIEETDGKSVDE